MFLLQAESAGAAVPLVAGLGGLQGQRQGGGLQHGQVAALPPGHVLAHHLGHLVPAGCTLKVSRSFRGNCLRSRPGNPNVVRHSVSVCVCEAYVEKWITVT